MRRVRSHLTYANVMATIAVFLVVGGGSAVALSGSNTVFTDDIANDTFNSPTQGQGGLVAADLRPNSVGTSEVVNESLTGADIKNRSGVLTCQTPLTAKFGPICAGSGGGTRTWNGALAYCADLGLRLPTFSEAVTLATKYDVPGVSGTQVFWTDELISTGSTAGVVDDGGGYGAHPVDTQDQTVCVTNPSA